VNFNSDPDGAMITTSDGKTLGLTPLSVEVPYSDSAVEYTFKKQGFEQKTMYIVPNLPSPLFATMQAIELKAPLPSPLLAPAAKSTAAMPLPTSSSSHHHHPLAPPPPGGKAKPDDDEVLEPSYR
jgi:hypothetical protein